MTQDIGFAESDLRISLVRRVDIEITHRAVRMN